MVELGRHAILRVVGIAREGSSPSSRTKTIGNHIHVRYMIFFYKE